MIRKGETEIKVEKKMEGEKAKEAVAMMTTKMKEKEKKKRKFEKKLVKFKNLPEYLQDNEYIVDYYRCEWPLKESFLSVFSLHNESLNIWTHLGGFLIFLGLTVMSCMETTELGGFISGFSRRKNSGASMMMMMNSHEFNDSDKNHMLPDAHLRRISQDSALSEAIPRWPWFVFLSGAMGCLVCSSMSHLLACHSKSFNLFFWRLDYAGIALMIVCSFVAPIYYVFYCNPFPQFFYITSITVIGAIVIVTLLTPMLSSPRYRPFRATLFLIMGLLGIIPTGHAVSTYWAIPEIIISLSLELVMAILYGIGVVFYVTRIPECWKPGAFDIAGHSHQIFHLFVVLAALAHSAATLIILDFRHRSPSCAS